MNEIQSNSCAVQSKGTFLWTIAERILCKTCFFFLAHAEDELTETTQALEPQIPGVWPARGSGVGCVLSVDCTWIPPPMAIQGAQILPSSVTPAARAGGGSTVGLGGLQEVPKEFC